MLIFTDHRIPRPAAKRLGQFGEVVPFQTHNLVYDAISGHPDIFMCRVNSNLIVAPNLPEKYKTFLEKKGINFLEGEEPVGFKYPQTATYNVVSNERFLMHNFRYTDSTITNSARDLDLIHLNQGYSRCNLLPLKNNTFITSDHGIYRILEYAKLEVLFVEPDDILLPGFKHGFIGGACGVFENKVFIIGQLSRFKEGNKVRSFLEKQNYEIVELYNGPLFDGGSLFFIL